MRRASELVPCPAVRRSRGQRKPGVPTFVGTLASYPSVARDVRAYLEPSALNWEI